MRIISTVILLYYSLASYGFAKPDSLVTYADLVFNSDLEKENFDHLINGEIDYFDLMSCIDTGQDLMDINRNKRHFDATIKELVASGIEQKKHTKQIKIVYNTIHDTYFDKYELENNFSKIFSSGQYNCVSATGLYAIAFKQLNIPYEIKELPTHVYLIAYPGDDRIVVEATNPTQGYTTYNESFKKVFAEEMIKLKLVSVSDAKSLSPEAIFNKYFFKDENISLKQLAGIQYFNDGLYKLEKEEYKEAYHQFEKSYYLYPHERAEYSMYTAASAFLSRLNPHDWDYAINIPMYAKFLRYGITSSDMLGEFSNLTNVWLFQKSDTSSYNKIYTQFKYLYADSIYRRDVNFIYYYENGRYLMQLGRREKAFTFVKKAFAVNPTNMQAQSFVIQLLSEKVARINNVDRVLKTLEDAKEEFPQLVTNTNFTNMILRTYLQMAHKMYFENNGKEGGLYLDKFETLYDEVEEADISDNAIGISYGSAGMYYYRRGSRTKAREQLNRGLKLSPGNRILEDRLKKINY